MDTKLFEQYKQLKEKIASLEEEKLSLEEQIFDAFDEDGRNSYDLGDVRFVRMSRRSWQYSDAVKRRAEELSRQKKIEEADGTATLKKETQYIREVANKE